MTVFFDQKNKKNLTQWFLFHYEELLLVRMENARGNNVIFIT